MAAPKGGDQLAEDMSGLAWLGVDIIVNLLTEPECWELGLLDEADEAATAGLEYRELPIADRGVPESRSLTRLVVELSDSVAVGRHVAIHCRAGIGRSSVLAAAMLRVEGVVPADAWTAITMARGVDVPDTPEQRHFIDQFDPR